METKIRIIIADANPDFCKLLTDLTSAEEDMEVVGTASDGIEALAMLAEFMPDILLLDLVLPKLDGLEVLRRLPETGAGSHVIVLSGFVNGKVVADCSARGADYFIPKPCDPARTAQPYPPAGRQQPGGCTFRRLRLPCRRSARPGGCQSGSCRHGHYP